MKEVVNFIKKNKKEILISVLIIIMVGVWITACVHFVLDTSGSTVELTQEEFELELIHVDLQKHYQSGYFQRLSYETIDVTKDTENYKVYLLTYLVGNDGRNEIWTYVARVTETDNGWDVDTEKVYYK